MRSLQLSNRLELVDYFQRVFRPSHFFLDLKSLFRLFHGSCVRLCLLFSLRGIIRKRIEVIPVRTIKEHCLGEFTATAREILKFLQKWAKSRNAANLRPFSRSSSHQLWSVDKGLSTIISRLVQEMPNKEFRNIPIFNSDKCFWLMRGKEHPLFDVLILCKSHLFLNLFSWLHSRSRKSLIVIRPGWSQVPSDVPFAPILAFSPGARPR